MWVFPGVLASPGEGSASCRRGSASRELRCGVCASRRAPPGLLCSHGGASAARRAADGVTSRSTACHVHRGCLPPRHKAKYEWLVIVLSRDMPVMSGNPIL